jgi:uncharacterized protein YndB with AHSA1/START domain
MSSSAELEVVDAMCRGRGGDVVRRTLATSVSAIALMLSFVVSAQAQPAVALFESAVVVDAPRQAAWDAVTTVEGIRGWLAPDAVIELRIGGPFEVWFTPEAADKGMTGTRILSFLPGEMLSYSGEMPTTWTVWRFEELDAATTRIRFAGMGTDPRWAAGRPQWDAEIPPMLDTLKRYLEGRGGR